MADAKLERLLNLTAALLDARLPLTADSIHERVTGYPEDRQSFRRQFERDKDALRAMGVPLRIEEVAGGAQVQHGYRIDPDDYYLPDPGLTADELAALHLAARAVRLEGVRGGPGLLKLGGAPEAGDAAGDGGGELADLPADPNLVVLYQAVADRRAVRLSTGGTEREVEPHRVLFTRGRWYVQGFDRLRGERRVYRLDRLDGPVEPVGDPDAFETPAEDPPALEPWQVGEGEPVEARVLLDAVVAPVVVQRLGEEVVEERRPDGSLVIRLAVTNPDGFRSFVLDLLDRAEVLSPPELRADVVAWLQACAGEPA